MNANNEKTHVAEQLAMFEASVDWQWKQTVRVTYRIRTLQRHKVPCEEELTQLQELNRRTAQTLREYERWLEGQGVRAEVERILAERKQTTKA